MDIDNQEIDNLIQELKSPSSFKRISALEKIFSQDNFPVPIMQKINDLRQNDPDDNVKRYINNVLGEREKAQEKIKLQQIVVVTTPMLEERTVKEYLGIVSAEVVFGTGFLSEFDAGLADMLGVRADKFQLKVKKAKDAAMEELRARAYELNANAILGVDLDYSVLTNNMLMVVANGTAVKVETSSTNELLDNASLKR